MGSSMTAPPSVLSPSSILPPPLSHFAFILAMKNLARVSNMLLFHLSLIFLELRRSASVCHLVQVVASSSRSTLVVLMEVATTTVITITITATLACVL
jgi:hypothetical protein